MRMYLFINGNDRGLVKAEDPYSAKIKLMDRYPGIKGEWMLVDSFKEEDVMLFN